MNPRTLLALGLLLAGLVLRYFVLISMQGYTRMSRKLFRWPEDAAAFGGITSDGTEEQRVERAQAALRNDSESTPFFLALAILDTLLGLEETPAFVLFFGYLAARTAHATWMVFPRQPARNRVFALGQIILMALVVDVLRRLLS